MRPWTRPPLLTYLLTLWSVAAVAFAANICNPLMHSTSLLELLRASATISRDMHGNHSLSRLPMRSAKKISSELENSWCNGESDRNR